MNSNFSKNLKNRDGSTKPAYDTLVNPLNEFEQEDKQQLCMTAKKVEGPNHTESDLVLKEKEMNNSQRSFRIRKGQLRSISRGSNQSKRSNLTHDQ